MSACDVCLLYVGVFDGTVVHTCVVVQRARLVVGSRCFSDDNAYWIGARCLSLRCGLLEQQETEAGTEQCDAEQDEMIPTHVELLLSRSAYLDTLLYALIPK
jgi:hypothetical protein